jgi:tRNA pseudouridine55 synthase
MDGIVLINKPKGPSSFRVVSKVRRLIGGGKVGHGGTLDPLATGVLVVLIGKATKRSSSLLTSDKEYRATIHLGVTTDTLDAEGTVMEEREVEGFSLDEIEGVLDSLRGEILQTPPMYSAVRYGGKRLYQLARKGVSVPVKPRRVAVHRLELLSYEHPSLDVMIECSKGTYVRALARDIGEKLGCGAHLADLTRTRVGAFRLEDCLKMSEVTEESLRQRLIEG